MSFPSWVYPLNTHLSGLSGEKVEELCVEVGRAQGQLSPALAGEAEQAPAPLGASVSLLQMYGLY